MKMNSLTMAILEILNKQGKLSFQALDRKIIMNVGLLDQYGNGTTGPNLSKCVKQLVDIGLVNIIDRSIFITPEGLKYLRSAESSEE